MTPKEELEKLKEKMIKDDSLPIQESTLVFGDGKADTDILFVGEAPGFYEDKVGLPFVGRAGQLLDKLINDIDWKREDVYITNVVKRRPPNNRDPLPEEIEKYKPYLKYQIQIIDPKIIVPLGRFAMNYFLPDAKISRDQGKAFWLGNRLIFPIYHPAAALRNPSVLEKTRESFIKLKKIFEDYDSFVEEREKKRREIEEDKKIKEKEQTLL
jgi:uracil-DNA glycosylase